MLDCIAICRCMDKKPCGNIMNTFTIDNLLGIAARRNLRGGLSNMKNNPVFEGALSSITGGVAKRPCGVLESNSQIATISRDYPTIGTRAGSLSTIAGESAEPG